MKKEFKTGTDFESETEYFATENIYHIYSKDTIELSDAKYLPLRGKTDPTFKAFTVLKNKKNVTLDFCGATIVLHGKIQPFLIDNSENITIKNCKVTYDRPPFTEFTIIESKSDCVKLLLNENCRCRIENGRLIPYSDTWDNTELNYRGMFFQVFDSDSRHGCGMHLGAIGEPFVKDSSFLYHVDTYKVEEDGEYIILKGNVPEFYKPGRKLVIAHEARNLSSIFMTDSKNIAVENYRVLCGLGMGIYSYRTENINLNGVKFTYDDESPCIVSNAADAIHTFGTSGEFNIKNCIIEGMIDDAINIHSNFRTVDHACENELYSNIASCEIQAKYLFKPGDNIVVYNGLTLEKAAEYVIEEIEYIDDEIIKLILDRPVQKHNRGDLIEDMSCNCNIKIDNCVIGKANSHLRLQSRGKVVMSDCENELELLLSGDASYWFESSPITDLTIKDCKFKTNMAKISITSEIMPTEKEPYYHKNIKIINNEFDTDIPVCGGYADGIVFEGNVNKKGKDMKLVLTNCGSVVADNCIVERKNEVKTELKKN